MPEHIRYINDRIETTERKKQLDSLKPKQILEDAKAYFKGKQKLSLNLEGIFKSKFSSMKSSTKTKIESERRSRVADL